MDDQATVGDLIDALSQLPDDTPLFWLYWRGSSPMSYTEMGRSFRVLRTKRSTSLYLDDGGAWHGELEARLTPLVKGADG